MLLCPKESGVGLVLSVAQNIIFFIGVPIAAEAWWPTFLRLKDELNIDIYPYMVAHVTLF